MAMATDLSEQLASLLINGNIQPHWFTPNEGVAREILQALKDENGYETYMDTGKKKMTIDDEDNFIDTALLEEVLAAKDRLATVNINKSKKKGPCDNIKSAFFKDREAIKWAELDKNFDFLLSAETKTRQLKNPLDPDLVAVNADRTSDVFYFVDICGGPGSCADYFLWRKAYYNAKVFGISAKRKGETTKTENYEYNFKYDRKAMQSSHIYRLEEFYPTLGGGTTTNPKTISEFQEYVARSTAGCGVDLAISNAAMNVAGQYNIEEILMKRLYLCQILLAISVLRNNGNIACRIFDTYTPFTAGLLYLTSLCFEAVTIHKPITSRDANSERYFVCKNANRERAAVVSKYLAKVNSELDRFSREGTDEDIACVIRLDILTADTSFAAFLKSTNEELAKRQIRKIQEIHGRCKPVQKTLSYDECLEYLELPSKAKSEPSFVKPADSFHRYFNERIDWNHYPARAFIVNRRVVAEQGKQLAFEQKIYTLLSQHSQHFAMMATETSVFFSNERFANGEREWESLNKKTIELPHDTIIFVECAAVREKNSNQACNIYRILDAAVLCGDNISSLSYCERMKCAEKLCAVLRKKEGCVRFVTAQLNTLQDIYLKGNIHGATVREGEYEFDVAAIRCTSVLKTGGTANDGIEGYTTFTECNVQNSQYTWHWPAHKDSPTVAELRRAI